MTRREFLLGAASGYVALKLPVLQQQGKVVRAAVITDLHHGLAPDAADRFAQFLAAGKKRRALDFALQMGDFCHPGGDSLALTKTWRDLDMPQLNVLGNHDMDKGSKRQIMSQWGMPSRFGSFEFGGFRFLILDLNHFKKNGELVAYANGNYFTNNATHNWADPEQLAWLGRELNRGTKPAILLSHQPLGFSLPKDPLPPEQEQVFDVILSARRSNPQGAVVACLSGHLHVDRIERVHGIPCVSVNSASYFWSQGMHPYRDPLFAFLELDPSGELRIHGRKSAFVREPPKINVPGMSASLSDRSLQLRKVGGWLGNAGYVDEPTRRG
jgi:hypothetical protein